MYKGVLTAAIATAVASAAIMMSGKKTSAEINEANETVVKANQNALAKTDSNAAVATSQQTTDTATGTVKQASDTVAKGADSTATSSSNATETDAKAKAEQKTAPQAEKVAQKQDVEVTSKTQGEEKTEVAREANYPPPPPGPFTEKKQGETAVSAMIKTPTAPTMPNALAAPKVPATPAITSEAIAESKAEMKVPTAPKVEHSAPQAPKVADGKIDVVTKSKKTLEADASAAPVKSKALQMLEDATNKSKTAVAPAMAVGAVTAAKVAGTTEDKAAAVKAPEQPMTGQLKAPDAPVEIHAPSKPEVVEIKMPEAPKSLSAEGRIAKPEGIPQTKINAPAKNQPTALQQPVMPQMVMPQGMLPQGMMMPPPQMLNGQRVIMVPVYPMNMGRPPIPMPNGYQTPSFGMQPQRNMQQQPLKPASQQQAPAKAPAKVEIIAPK